MTITLRALSLVEKAEPVQVCFTLRLRDQWSMWMHDGCKVYMDSYMASKGSCFMITWTISKNHLLEVGLTQNRKTMALQTLTTVKLFDFYHVWGPAWLEIYWNSIWLRVQSYDFTLHLRVHDHNTWFWRCLGTAFGHFLLGSQKFRSRFMVRVWSGPKKQGQDLQAKNWPHPLDPLNGRSDFSYKGPTCTHETHVHSIVNTIGRGLYIQLRNQQTCTFN
jgi:hypothetical protein